MIRPAGPAPPKLFRLRKEHQHTRATSRHQLILRLLRVARNGLAIALLVANRFAVHEQHVVMRAVARNVVQRHLPDVPRIIRDEWHLLPFGERAHNFNGGRFRCLAGGQTPAENLGESLRTFRFRHPNDQSGWDARKDWSGSRRRFPAVRIVRILKHASCLS